MKEKLTIILGAGIAISVIVTAVLYLTAKDTLRIFDLIYILTNGGPGGATTSLSLFSFQYFVVSDFGRGTAVSVILFIIAFLFSILYLRFGRFQETLRD